MSMLDSPTVALPIVTPKRHRKRWGRKRTVATIVGMLVLVPAVAWAAFVYFFGSITGATTISATDAKISITSVASDVASGVAPDGSGVTCNATKTGAQAINLAPNTSAVTVGGVTSTTPGVCTVDVALQNDTVGAGAYMIDAVVSLPTGWTIVSTSTVDGSVPGPVRVSNGGGSGVLRLTITADGTATAATITPGKLSLTAA